MDRRRIPVCLWIVIMVATLACAHGQERGSLALNDEVTTAIEDGRGLFAAGDHTGARARLAQATRDDPTPDHRERIAAWLSEAGYVLYRAGNYPEAMRYYEAALDRQAIGPPAPRARTLNSLANLHKIMGDFAQAKSLLELALALAADGEIAATSIQAMTLNNLARLDLVQRHYQAAVDHLQEVMALAWGEPDVAAEKVRALQTLGAVYRQQGDFDAAMAPYEEALHHADDLGLASEAATSQRILGELQLNRPGGDYRVAERYLQAAYDGHRALGEELEAAIALTHLGEVAAKHGDYALALERYGHSLPVFTDRRYVDGIGRVHYQMGAARAGLGQREEAISAFDRALACYRRLADREWIWRSLLARGRQAEQLGQLTAAEDDYREGVETFESIRGDVAGGDAARTVLNESYRRLYESLISLLVRVGKVADALVYAARTDSHTLRANLLMQPDSDRHCHELLMRYAELAHREARIDYAIRGRRSTGGTDRSRLRTLQQTRDLAETDLQAVEEAIGRELPGLHRGLALQPVSASGGMVPLPPGVALLRYLPVADEVLIFIQVGTELSLKRVPLARDDLRRGVAEFRDVISAARFDPTGGWRPGGPTGRYNALLQRQAVELYDRLIAPVAEQLDGIHTLVIIPHGVLAYLPFAALAAESADGVQFLIERFDLLRGVAGDRGDLPQTIPPPDTARVAVFSDPDLHDDRWALPDSRALAREVIPGYFPRTEVYVGATATKENFRRLWGSVDMIHLGAHAILTEASPFLLLAPPALGRLSACEITGLPPATAELVVLEACETGVGIDDGGSERLASLALAFAATGADSVIATLWRVSARGSNPLLAEFYRRLAHGEPPDHALRHAQQEMLARDDRYAQPYYWAPYVNFQTL